MGGRVNVACLGEGGFDVALRVKAESNPHGRHGGACLLRCRDVLALDLSGLFVFVGFYRFDDDASLVGFSAIGGWDDAAHFEQEA